MGAEEVETANGTKEISDVESKIIRQVEYYFGDYNLCRDRFLKGQVQENEGWVPLEIMVKFQRLKQISEDFDVIASALRKSPNKLLEVNEEGTQIRRSPLKPLPDETDERKADVMSRSVYVKGFKINTSLDELLEFFKQFGNAENVLMRKFRDGKRKFKGSVFVTFQTEDEAKKFLDEKVVEYQGSSLNRETKKQYLDRKEVEYLERRKLAEEKQALKEKGESDDTNTKKVNTKSDVAIDFTTGCLLKLSGFNEETMREDIRPILAPLGEINFIDFMKGDPEGVVRFESPINTEAFEKISEEVDGSRRIKINEADVLATILTGEIEESYYKDVKRKFMKMKNKSRRGQGYGRGRFGKGYRGGKGRKRQFDDEDKNKSFKRAKKEKSTDEQVDDTTHVTEEKLDTED